MTSQELKRLREEVTLYETRIQQYQSYFAADGHIDTEEQQQLDRMQTTINTVRKRLRELDEQTEIPETVEAVLKEFEDREEGVLPEVIDVAEGCQLVIAHYGTLQPEGKVLPELFAINNEPTERLQVPANSEGTISIISNWTYLQQKSPLHKENARARRIFQFDYYYITDPKGGVQVQKTGTLEVRHEWDRAVSLFDLQPAVTQASNRIITIEGGLQSNKSLKDKVDDAVWNDVIEGATLRTRTVGVHLNVAEEVEAPFVPVAPKELVFENENQAVLSSDEIGVLIKWWKETRTEVKEKIRSRHLYIEVTGYTSATADNLYNYKLGGDRAKHVKSLLIGIIGIDEDGNSAAKILSSSLGEETEDSRRYVRISIKENN